MIRAYLTTTLCMLILGSVGLLTARDISLNTLNMIFYLAFLPSVAAGMFVFFVGSLTKAESCAKPLEKQPLPAQPYRTKKA